MKKVVLAAALMFLFIIPGVLATKTILYVTSDTGDVNTCSGITSGSEDRKFCDRLETIGYDVTTIEPSLVRDGASHWQTLADGSDLIFVGDVTVADVYSSSSDRDNFCSNINNYITADRKVFMTFRNVYKDNAGIEGCAFGSPVNLGVSTSLSDNNCEAKRGYTYWSKLNEGSITVNLDIDSDHDPPIYSTSNHEVRVHGQQDGNEGWIGTLCSDVSPSGTYSVVNTTDRGAFWGLLNPSDFTSQTWEVFDRTIYNLLGEDEWIVDVISIPRNVTQDTEFLLYALVTAQGSHVYGILNLVNYTTIPEGDTGSLSLITETSDPSFGYRYTDSIKLSDPFEYLINVTAHEKDKVLKGYGTDTVTCGNLTINIHSGDYQPGASYTINVSTYSGSSPLGSDMYYRIWNMSNFSIIGEGPVNALCNSNHNLCQQIITPSDWGRVILEVVAENSSMIGLGKYGGNYKIINPTTGDFSMATDKDSYTPEEIVVADVYTEGAISGALLTIRKPDGQNLIDSIDMDQINATHWSYSYSLEPSSINGNYTLITSVPEIGNKSKIISVKAWNILSTLDNSSYDIGDNVTITVTTQNVYTDMNFTVSIDVTDPDGNAASFIDEIENNGTSDTIYSISSNATSGSFSVDILVNDSYRNYTSTLSFNAGGTALSVTPLNWEVVTDTSGIETKKFTITNGGSSTLHDINITEGGELEPYISLTKNNISSLSAGGSTDFTAYLNVSVPGNHTGTITIDSDVARIVIDISLNYNATVQPQSSLVVTPTFISEVTVPDEVFDKSFSLENKDTVSAANIEANLSGTASQVVSIVTKPNTISASGKGTLKARVDTTGTDVGTYSGKINIYSSVGNAQVDVTIDVIDDLSVEAQTLTLEVQSLQQNITDLKNRGKDTTDIEALYNDALTLLEEASDAYLDKDYPTSKSKYDSAMNKISDLRSSIASLENQQEPPPDYGIVIWVFAIVIVVAIAGITFFKYRDKVTEIINNLLGKKKRGPKEEKRDDDKYYYPSGEEGYRTEYY